MKWLAFAMVTTLAARVAAEPTQQYIVQSKDSCIAIAIHVLGDRMAVHEIHRLNPQLGPQPHRLVPGSILVLPIPAVRGPDARLTRANGDVKIRKPTAGSWDAAQRGMDLFRAYRVGAAARASAELTFSDDASLGMRERTIVVLYGPEKRLAKVITATADLERGTLETRLGELDGKPVAVKTPTSQTQLRGGDVVVTSNDGGPSVYSNHRGRAFELRGRTRQARPGVKVAAGMGTRVFPGKVPEPPRPLPPTPAWSSSPGPRMATPAGTIALAWNPAERAVHYRVAIRAAGDLVAAQLTTVPSVELVLDPGKYSITVAAFDADGLESAPSDPLAIERIAPVFVAPNGRVPGAGAATPQRVAVGTTLVSPEGIACSAGDRSAQRLVLDAPGIVTVRCTDAAGLASEPIAIEVVALGTTAGGVARPDRLEPSRPIERRAYTAELGAYTGYHSVAIRRPIDLGATDEMHALDDGPTLGIRGGLYRERFGIEAELGLSSLDRVGANGRGHVLAGAVHATLQREEDRATLRLLAGLGLATALRDDAVDERALVPGFSWGGAATFDLRRISIRIDLRHIVAAGHGGMAHALEATVGASIVLAP